MYFVLQILPSAPLAGDTDYSDPFDARLDHRPEVDFGPVPCENSSYMEPYEAQRVITGQWDGFQRPIFMLLKNVSAIVFYFSWKL